jgi:spore maturation protein CgeB
LETLSGSQGAAVYKILLSTTIERVLPLGQALKDIGYDVYIFDASIKSPVDQYMLKPMNKTLWNLRLLDKKKSIGSQTRFCNKNFRGQKLLEVMKTFKPQCVLFEIGFKPPIEVLQQVKQNIHRIGGWWTMSARWINLEDREKTFYDAFFVFTEEFADTAKGAGYNAFYLPHAVNNYVFKPLNLTRSERDLYQSDITFVGGWKKTREMVVDALNCLNIKIKVYGPGWLKRNLFNPGLLKCIKGSGLYGDELVKNYISSKIVLNINAWFTEKTYGINQRVFDVPACGAFLLTDYVDGLDSFFKIGEEIETYISIDELIDKVRFYIANDNLREKIARRGYEKAQKLPTWKDRARDIAQTLGLPLSEDR